MNKGIYLFFNSTKLFGGASLAGIAMFAWRKTRRPRYIWARLKDLLHQRLNPNAPWLAPKSLAYIDAHLGPQSKGVEWGSGRSTLWFARRCGTLLTIEDHVEWREQVERMIDDAGLAAKVQMAFIDEVDVESYASAATVLPESSCDFALVDGSRDRDLCTKLAIRLLRPGGMLILDNAERYLELPGTEHLHQRYWPGDQCEPGWTELREIFGSWSGKVFENGVSATYVTFKPSE